jgi:integrase
MHAETLPAPVVPTDGSIVARPPYPPQPIEAANDAQAVALWLRTYAGSPPPTLRAYRTAIRRFMAWLYAREGFASALLPQVTVNVVHDYIGWLNSPDDVLPAEALRLAGAPGAVKRGILSPPSIRHTLIILHTMYEALRNFRGENGPYCTYNPFWAARKKVLGPKQANPRARALTVDEMALVKQALAELPEGTPALKYRKARAHWVFALLYRLWLRRSEPWSHRMGDLRRTPNGWEITVVGKGNKSVPLPVPSALIDELRLYRRAVGWTDFPTPGESYPLVGSAYKPDDRVSDQAIYYLVTQIGSRAAALATDPVVAERLAHLSPHWMRHTGISRFLGSGGDPRHAQYFARHESANTTSLYDTREIQAVRRDLERDW